MNLATSTETELLQPLAPGFVPPALVPTETLRVLHVINGEHYSGAERVQDLLAACLPHEGFRVEFACLKPGRLPQQRQTVDVPL